MGEYMYAIFWIVLAVILGVFELASVQLVAIWFAVGALAAAIPAMLNASFLVQAIVFVAVSAVALLLTRPLAKKFLIKKQQPTNADMLIGKVAVVVEPLDKYTGQGRVNVMGLDWLAREKNHRAAVAGEHVKIMDIQGATLVVKLCDDAELLNEPETVAK